MKYIRLKIVSIGLAVLAVHCCYLNKWKNRDSGLVCVYMYAKHESETIGPARLCEYANRGYIQCSLKPFYEQDQPLLKPLRMISFHT